LNIYIVVATRVQKERTHMVHAASEEEALSAVERRMTGWTLKLVATKDEPVCMIIYDNEKDFSRYDENFEEVRKLT
jgi:hypothetical protein